MKSFYKIPAYKIPALFIAASLMLTAVPAQAQEKTASGQTPSGAIQSAFQDAVESVEQLVTVKDSELNAEEKARLELEARKNALAKIIDLTILEIEDLKNKLKKLDPKDFPQADYLPVRDEFLKVLDKFIEYHVSLQEIVEKSLKLEEVKNLAAEFKNWREANYSPQIRKILDFILVFQGNAIIKIVDRRLEKIINDLKKLGNSKLIDVKKLEPLLEEAITSINAARELNANADELLQTALFPPPAPESDAEINPEENSAENPTTTETIPAPEEPAPAPAPVITIQKLIEESLVKIKNAYIKFMEMGSLIKANLKIN